MTDRRPYTESDIAYILETAQAQTAVAQAAHLGRSYGSVRNKRSELLQAGLLSTPRWRPWSEQEVHEAQELIQSGYGVRAAAKKLGTRSPRGIAWKLGDTGASVSATRDGAIKARSIDSVARLFGVARATVRQWIKLRLIHARRNGHGPRSQRLVSDLALMDFVTKRSAWPYFDVARITDPDWRAAAMEARAAAAGRWVPVGELAALLYYSTDQTRRWLRDGRLGLEAVFARNQWHVWLAQGAQIQPAPDRRQNRPVKAAGSHQDERER